MGLLRRPTPGEIVEGGRLGRPCGPSAFAGILRKPGCGYAANPAFTCRTSTSQIVGAGPVSGCSPPPTCRLGHRNDPQTVRSDASCMASTPRVISADQLGSCGRLANNLERRHGPLSVFLSVGRLLELAPLAAMTTAWVHSPTKLPSSGGRPASPTPPPPLWRPPRSNDARRWPAVNPGPGGGRSRRPRPDRPLPAWPGCWRRARPRSWG
jgi:hypothetical protein